jgi:hypothetical protein
VIVPPPGDEPEEWVDEQVVRPFALTGGRTRHAGEFDLMAVVQALAADAPATCGPEHENILWLCTAPLSVAEIASDLDLPVGVVRVLLGDLHDHGLVHVRRPAPVTQLPHGGVLKEVIDGLHAL